MWTLFMSLTESEIGEGFFTIPIWIRFLCNVTPSKSVMTTGVVEWFSTMLTYIRLFLQCELFHGCSDDHAKKRFSHNACMYKSSASCSVAPFVCVTPTGVVEGFATMLMHKVFLQCGSCYVCYNYWGGWRRFHSAYMHKVSLLCEFFHVCLDYWHCWRFFPMLAGIRFLCSVASFMAIMTTGMVEGLSTMLTCIMTLCHVYSFTNVTSTATSEWFSKILTRIRFLSSVYSFMNVTICRNGEVFPQCLQA